VIIYLSTSPKAPPANVSLTRTGGVVDLDIDDHREGTSIHFHDPAPLIIIVHERSGGDTDPEVKWNRAPDLRAMSAGSIISMQLMASMGSMKRSPVRAGKRESLNESKSTSQCTVP
jgi:hypothetical protein